MRGDSYRLEHGINIDQIGPTSALLQIEGHAVTEPDIIDQAALDTLLATTGGDPAFLAELIDTYLDDSGALLATMHQAIAAANAVELRRAAHSLKSNSASFGAHTLVGLCRVLEQRARDGLLDGAAARLEAIQATFAQVERALRTLRPAR